MKHAFARYGKYSLTAAAVLVVFSACGKSPAETVRDAQNSIKNSDLNHSWQEEGCRDSGALKLAGASTRVVYEFHENHVIRKEQYFANTDCRELAVTLVYSGTFEKRDEVQKDVTQLNFQFTQAQAIAESDAGRGFLETTKFCGESGWKIGSPVDLTARTRDSLCPVSNLPMNTWDIYSIENDRLFFGRGDDKGSPEKRPSVLNRDQPFHQI